MWSPDKKFGNPCTKQTTTVQGVCLGRQQKGCLVITKQNLQKVLERYFEIGQLKHFPNLKMD